MKILPSVESAGVIPVESPTVPKADTTSKTILASEPGAPGPDPKSVSFSVTVTIMVIKTMINIEIDSIPIAS